MTTVTLDDAQAAQLRTVLDSYLSDLRMEIADTDRQAYREMLHERARTLEAVIEQLDSSGEVTPLH